MYSDQYTHKKTEKLTSLARTSASNATLYNRETT